MARLFLALWPGAAVRDALSARASEVAGRHGGRAVAPSNLHLTLVFLGEVDDARVPALKAAAGAVCPEAFTLVLDRIGGFRRAGVAWAGCARVPAGLLALQAELESRIRDAGFRPDERTFSPHLTLARKVRGRVEPASIPALEWPVAGFALVESVRPEGAYRTLAQWPLAPEKT